MQSAEQSPEEYRKSLLSSIDLADELGKYLGEIQHYSIEINKVFTQGRQRVSELITGIADATPQINRLGGSMKDVAQVMGDIAEASNRNLIASVEETEKLFAAQQILQTNADILVNSFNDVGVGLSKIPEELEKSINYVQSIGGNAKQVMKDVTYNMSQMNRFQFEGGVAGLTKMAAQASMLRFNMGETFRLADKVLDPEGAIEVASAFQRLGVSAGNLVDPFQLMNMSINDPSGLQDSLADVAKQFSYFDEETKTFKINPQGVLTLREMEKQTGVSAQEMSKMAVAAAELDKRLSAVDMAGVTIGSEEDKQFLANISKMDKSGEYVVQIKDDEGEVETKKLSEVTQKEFDKLIQEQREGPKTMEDITRTQMGISKTIQSDVAAIKNTLIGGGVSAKQVTQTLVGAQKTADVLGGEATKKFGKTEVVRGETEKALTDVGRLFKDLADSDKSRTESLSQYLEKVGTQMNTMEVRFKEAMKEYGENVSNRLNGNNLVEKSFKFGVDEINKIVNNDKVKGAPLENKGGNQTIAQSITQTTQTINNKGTVDVGGKIQVDVQVPAGVSESQVKQIIDSAFNDPKFKDYVVRLVTPNNNLTEPVKKTF
jgi:hypothetical protein